MLANASAETHAAYAAPFQDPLARFAIYRPFQDIPVGGVPQETHQILEESYQFLKTSSIPKLYIYPEPGFATAMPEGSPDMVRHFKNIELQAFGPGGHFLQEENAPKLAFMIGQWLAKN